MPVVMGIEPLTTLGALPVRIRVYENESFTALRRRRRRCYSGNTGGSLRRILRCIATMASDGAEKKMSTERRDKLLGIEKIIQKRWEDAKIFEVDASDEPPKPGEKYFGNFPYPYMNGVLHLGHAFSLSKLAAFQRLCGTKVLLPMGFHCTGMPIKACADKLVRESEEFGCPPVFPTEVTDEAPAPVANKEEVPVEVKFKAKKSKAVAKSGASKYQWTIMRSLGLEDDEIAKFRDPLYWLEYFPPIAKNDLKFFGLSCDWRRSFITTEANPYYDSFVRWQFEHLREKKKVGKDLRYAIYSPLDRQPCADHDRASGEGVAPQEYVLIKMEVQPPFTGKLKPLEGKKVFLAAATLRPETMYGQTNAWVLADGDYGAYEVSATEVFVVTARAALNMAYQNLSRVPQQPTCLVELKGQDLIGLTVVSPLAKNPVVYVLPMLNIKTDKGTGVVTSVPSDSPDDYMALSDLKSKPALRAKFNVQDEWVLPFEVLPIINVPEFGDKSAEAVCISMKIKSQNNRDDLEAAKKMTYLKGFTDGKMLVGDYARMKVQEAKPLIKKLLVESGQAVIYSEPEKKVISRSGDECVVALTDQWYLQYAEEEWKSQAEKCLTQMELYSDETRRLFEHALGWLNQWACSRSFGLGTKFPWDQDFLIESLSDSTIYMAYYTLAHILQEGDLYGKGDHAVKPNQMTRNVWDFVFGMGPLPESEIPVETLKRMKKEFDYWYPFDLRVSGKDLIQNHLTFSIYNHTAMFPEERWPRSFRCNGFLLLNGEKMAKSTGNFLTIRDAVSDFSADATRFGLADAGDSVDDANFVKLTANSAILRLTKEMAWMSDEVIAAEKDLRKGSPTTFADRVFENEINIAINQTERNYKALMFREALKSGFYDLQIARDEYRLACSSLGMNRDLIFRFADVQTRLLTPICPHYAEYVRSEIFHQEGFAVTAGWPASGTPDLTLQRANKFFQSILADFRKALQKHLAASKKAKKGQAAVPPAAPLAGLIYVAEKYEGWKEESLKILQSCYDSGSKTFTSDVEILSRLRESSVGQSGDFKQIQKKCMPFVKFKKDETLSVGPQALELRLPFDERWVFEENLELIKAQLGLESVMVVPVSSSSSGKIAAAAQAASPGSPVIVFVTVPEMVAALASNGVAQVTVS
ncbi:leucine--tRNA ligase, cytoplasmic [Selaginella moellendorffii]|nr:leucine--tRNA ligase, cytoplasmic [Selaginella moellendorffii]|eukprot:XP_002990283.2 leucine--tRNA ligase, cytoplasmic [Selaginella moellendorffii]